MTSAFIIQVQPQLQKDPNDETAALLRVLIHKIDNTTFGGDVPALPQWTGPPRVAIQVQWILYASLAASLLSAFLAMLGKQWLNRYASVNMRGSAIERSQNRQRKLDGIIAWYFDHVLESLPLVLQVALLLLGCALSRYLWGINTAVASVVVGVTSFGVLFYLFIVIAGATSDGCPYQTPWTNIIRRLLHLFVEHSAIYRILFGVWSTLDKDGTTIMILAYPLALLLAFVIDACRLGRATFRSFVASAHKACSWLFGTSSIPKQTVDCQATELDFRCILWMLQTSLDKTIRLSTLNFLNTILALPGFNPDIAVSCFNIFSSCFIADSRYKLSIARGSEQLVEISAMCLFRAFSHLLVVEPTSTTIGDLRQRYTKVFSFYDHLLDPHLPFIAKVVHCLFFPGAFRAYITWTHYNPPPDELIPFAHTLAQLAQFEYRRGEHENHKVPRWLVRFALRFLSQNPLPPTPTVIDCLTIIATDLGCDVSDINKASDEKCVHTPKITVSPLTLHQHMAWATFRVDGREI